MFLYCVSRKFDAFDKQFRKVASYSNCKILINIENLPQLNGTYRNTDAIFFTNISFLAAVSMLLGPDMDHLQSVPSL